MCFIFQPVNNADFVVPVEIDGTVHQVSYVVTVAFYTDVSLVLVIVNKRESPQHVFCFYREN